MSCPYFLLLSTALIFYCPYSLLPLFSIALIFIAFTFYCRYFILLLSSIAFIIYCSCYVLPFSITYTFYYLTFDCPSFLLPISVPLTIYCPFYKSLLLHRQSLLSIARVSIAIMFFAIGLQCLCFLFLYFLISLCFSVSLLSIVLFIYCPNSPLQFFYCVCSLLLFFLLLLFSITFVLHSPYYILSSFSTPLFLVVWFADAFRHMKSVISVRIRFQQL